MKAYALRSSILLLLACNDAEPLAQPSAVATLSLRPTSATIQIGQRLNLTPTLLDGDGAELTDRAISWTSSNADVATVASGLVTGVNDGQAVITATAEGRTAQTRVTVQLEVAEVVIEPQSPVIATGTSVQLTATPRGPAGLPLDDRLAQWISLNPRVAIVNVGKVRGLRVGTAQIVATVEGRSAETTVSVVPNISGPWQLAVSVEDADRGIACSGAGLLTVTQTGPTFVGVHERLGSCQTPDGPVSDSGQLTVGDASLSPERLDFLLRGELICAYAGVLTGTPPAAATGDASCAGEVGGVPVTLRGTWEMRR
ncbi:MAG TPA: Ig-like domain-containing protein [Gemmatimonadales bacterium]|nr:Ig-like domain-containing protein [Gemmatimonadales bacterium]